METKEKCIICFEDTESSEMIRKWECSHTFHKDCIDCWDNNCPMCRNKNLIVPEITFQITRNPSCPYWLQTISQICPILSPSESANYIDCWKDTDCTHNNHEIIVIVNDNGFKKNIYAICEDCNTYQMIDDAKPILYSFCPLNRNLMGNLMRP